MGTADARQRERGERWLFRFENEVQRRHELAIVQACAEASRDWAHGQAERQWRARTCARCWKGLEATTPGFEPAADSAEARYRTTGEIYRKVPKG